VSKFTKGEWRVELSKHGNIESAMVFYPHGFLTSANVIKNDESRLEGESWVAMRKRTAAQRKANELESIANMHLIAAAPDMYDALKDLNKLIAEGAEHGFTDHDWMERLFFSQRKTSAALRKADGKG
jgi:hypothetical protein